jgi:adenosylhomocysteine nucleosidase
MERIIGIMGAMPEEINGVVALLEAPEKFVFGKRIYYKGHYNGIQTIVVFSRWGKVAASTTVSTLIHEFGITELVFTGVAGAIQGDLNIGDIVIAKRLVQHDMDARPLMPQFEIPLLDQMFIESDKAQLKNAESAVRNLLEREKLHAVIEDKDLKEFGIQEPKVVIGDIASGDQFFSCNHQKKNLLSQLPSIQCVEMEGAAVAQVCYEYEIPFVIIRTISDVADEQAPIGFPAFIKTVASKYSVEIIKNMYERVSV